MAAWERLIGHPKIHRKKKFLILRVVVGTIYDEIIDNIYILEIKITSFALWKLYSVVPKL